MATRSARRAPVDRPAHRRRPSLRVRGAVGVVVALLACGLATTVPAAPAPAAPAVDNASWWRPGATQPAFLGGFLRWFFRVPVRYDPPRPAPPTPRPPAPPTTASPAPPPSAPTSAPPAGTPTTAAPPPAPGTPNTNCTLIVPPGALTAVGLATPYRFVATDPAAGPCHEANADQSAFVEAAILDPASGAVSVYHPLVIDDGTTPAVAPVVPTLPRGAVVAVWFGFQADNLTLHRHHARRGLMRLRYDVRDGCVNGLGGSLFSQFAYCGAPRFFAAATALVRAGRLAVPPVGTGADGKPCPTTRDFVVVDQDQSDNLPTKYLALPDGRTAQDSPANRTALPGARVLTNGSDNGLLDNRIDPALGCTPFTAPDLSAGGAPSPALALNELQAAAHQGAPVALVPPIDPMTLVDGRTSIPKTDLYRAGVNMPRVNPRTDTGLAYCQNLATVAPARLQLDRPFFEKAGSPAPEAANLFDFLTQRLTATWTNLGCQDLTHQGPPVVGAPAPVAPAVAPAPSVPPTPPAPVPSAAPTAGPTATAAPTADPTAAAAPTTGRETAPPR